MVGKRRLKQQNFIFEYLAGTVVIILLLFKYIGDLLIFFGKIFLFILLFPFKIFNIFAGQLRLIIGKFFKLIQKFSLPKIKFRKGFSLRNRVIFHRRRIPVPNIRFKIIKIRFPFMGFFRNTIAYSAFQITFVKMKYFILGSFAIGIIALYYQINLLVVSLPNPNFLTQRDITATTKIYDRNGKFLYEIYADENRTPIKLSDIPDIVKKATIAIEDKDFFYHKGYDPKGILRALIHNYNDATTLQGGSTITQQLVRSALLTPDRTWERKIKEILLSIRTEQLYSKNQILEMYLNQVPYGGTAWGIEAASQIYFGKSVKDLNLAQAALLAGLPASPTSYSPFGSTPELAFVRQKEVLNKMRQAGFITDEEKENALNTALVFRKPYIPIYAPHFVMYVKELLENQYGPRLVSQGGLRVTTTLDLSLQEDVQKIVSSQVDALNSLHVTNGASLVTNPKNGEILAMVGSKDYFNKEIGGNVNLTTAQRQPGSSIKVVNYAAALSMGFTAASYLDDSPITYRYPGQTSYSPVNYDGRYHGWVSLRSALGSSYNIPAVKVLNSIGVNRMVEQGKLMGITSWNNTDQFGLSLTLGGGSCHNARYGKSIRNDCRSGNIF